MKQHVLVVCAALSLAGCGEFGLGQHYAQTTTAAEREAAKSAVTACVERNWPLLDDRVSPAPVIAHALAEACESEISAWATIYNQGMPPSWREGVYQQAMTGQAFTSTVLALRAKAISRR